MVEEKQEGGVFNPPPPGKIGLTVNDIYSKVNVTNLKVEIMRWEEGLERHGRHVS